MDGWMDGGWGGEGRGEGKGMGEWKGKQSVGLDVKRSNIERDMLSADSRNIDINSYVVDVRRLDVRMACTYTP